MSLLFPKLRQGSLSICVNSCSKTPSGNSPCRKNVHVDSSLLEKSFQQVFDLLRSPVGSGQKWSSWVKPERQRFTSWRGTSFQNSDNTGKSLQEFPDQDNLVRKVTSSLCSWTHLIWLTDLLHGNQHYYAAPIRKLCSWRNRFFKNVEFLGKHFVSSLPLPLLALFCACPNFRAFKKQKMLQTCGKPYTMETLAT